MVQPDNKIGGKRDPGQWIHIDDFSPGCFDPSNISTVQPLSNQPLGAADITGTFACSVIKGGSLGPMPGITDGLQYSAYGGLPGGSTVSLLAGFIVNPNNNEIVAIFESDDGTSHYVVAASYVPGGSVNAIAGPTETVGTSPGFFGAPYPAFTRLNVDGTTGPPPPGPVLVFPTSVASDSSGDNGHLWVYPELLDPTSYTAQDLIVSGSSITGQVITYGNRVICIAGVDYEWPTPGGINTNENFNYTDPPESAEYGNQQTILAVESPWGYGAWGTESVGELLLVKKSRGGVILNGDINVPSSVIPVPGLQPTGDFVGRAASTPVGLIYCSQNRGAWVWNGGNTSSKISQNINDSFFDLETNNVESNNYGFFVEFWQKWVMFSGNVWLDTDTNSWWNIYPRSGITVGPLVGRDFWWYSIAAMANQVQAAPLLLNNNTDDVYSTIDNTGPSEMYQWQSLPIHVVDNADRTIDIRQIIIRASDPANTGEATITVNCPNSDWAGDTSETGTTPIGEFPTIVRFNVGMGNGVQDIVLQIQAQNVGAGAPIIESIDIEYKVRQSQAVAN